MITDILLYLISFILNIVSFLLPQFSVWPTDFLNGLQYFVTQISVFNFIVPISTLFAVILFLLNFEVYFFGAKLLMKLIGFIRGTGSGLEL